MAVIHLAIVCLCCAAALCEIQVLMQLIHTMSISASITTLKFQGLAWQQEKWLT